MYAQKHTGGTEDNCLDHCESLECDWEKMGGGGGRRQVDETETLAIVFRYISAHVTAALPVGVQSAIRSASPVRIFPSSPRGALDLRPRHAPLLLPQHSCRVFTASCLCSSLCLRIHFS